ncbi:flagellar biosynthesis protein FlhF [Ferrimonas marina]|uniref:Flagellar biosynthesis protein FlhF n=1 Tax=Ferrimonas marina TaxID=299255 RepID=A0A1M5YE98_9GAMM|nr:flagellar biosynthesis protein FlhF [Ferrimonas marina]SHI10390.1 flagellar biosynthesis protein FlhF [Ferrimonas marina]
MKIKRFFAKDMRSALAEVKEVLGQDAVIMSNKRVSGGVEIVAAVDFDQPAPGEAAPSSPAPDRSLSEDKVSLSSAPSPRPKPAATPKRTPAESASGGVPSSDSLRALLERQQQRRQQKEAKAMVAKQEQALPKWAQRAFEPEKAKPAPRPAELARAPAPRSTRASNGANQAELNAMREEMASIRQLLQHQVAGLMQQDMARQAPVRAMVIEQLRDLGFHKEVAEHFAEMLPQHGELHEVLAQLPQLVADELICGNEAMLEEGGVIALVGPTGVGKTTTIAKLAARFAARYGVEQVALITTDNYRIGAQEQLTTFGKIMGCPVRSAATVEELEQVLYQLRSRRLVLIDTAGMGQRDMRLVEQLEQLAGSSRLPIKPYLVLSATAQYRVLQETVERFRRIDLAGCIFTKLDEAHSIGEALSVLLQSKLPVCYLTDGQRVPEDLRAADPHYLAQRALVEENDGTEHTEPRQVSGVGRYD